MAVSYFLTTIDNVHYLMPFGQAVSSQGRAVKLNDTGVIMWKNLLKYIDSEPDLSAILSCQGSAYNAWLNDLYDTFQADCDGDRQIIYTDAAEFIRMLYNSHVFNAPLFHNIINIDSTHKDFTIAGINVSFDGPSLMFPEDFNSFLNTDGSFVTDFNITVDGTISRNYPTGTLIIENRDVCIFREPDKSYLILFNNFSVIKECEIEPDFKSCHLFYQIPSMKETKKCIHALLNEIDYKKGTYETFHAIRMAFLLYAKMKGIYALHSASFLYRDKLWLISAPAGTGKSTHANLWNREYGTPVINGDLNFIDITGDSLYVKGSPWCGTSGIFDDKTYELGGIIFLSQGKDNTATGADSLAERTLLVANGLISPSWTADMLDNNIKGASAIASGCLVFSLSCDATPQAAKVCKDFIDAHIQPLNSLSN